MKEDRVKYLLFSIAETSDRMAFNELFSHYFPGLVSFANSIIKERQLSEEVVEDVFLKLWENRRTLTSIRNFSHYIYTAAKYASFNALKSRKRRVNEEIGDDFVLSYNHSENKILSKENLRLIEGTINSLPPKCRIIFRLIKEDGLKYEETAQLLGISVKTVECQMSIATKKLIEQLRILLPEYKSIIARKRANNF